MHSRDGWCEHPTVVSKVLLVEMKRIFLVKILLVVLLELSADCCSSKHTSKRISAMNVVKFVKTIYLCLFCAHFKQKSTPFFLRILSHFTQRPEKVVVNSFWTKTAATVKCLRGNSNCKGRERPRMLNLRNRSTASLQADPDRGIGRTEASAPLQRSPRGKRTWDRTRQIRRREKHKKLENRGRNRKLRYPYSLQLRVFHLTTKVVVSLLHSFKFFDLSLHPSSSTRSHQVFLRTSRRTSQVSAWSELRGNRKEWIGWKSYRTKQR